MENTIAPLYGLAKTTAQHLVASFDGHGGPREKLTAVLAGVLNTLCANADRMTPTEAFAIALARDTLTQIPPCALLRDDVEALAGLVNSACQIGSTRDS
ncbi:hypothetical protein [Limnoglobus roseus]|uniref:Uncharacterized protein n=1 Tax=Limnoglobus roseus TaxID=2598579 RepID=A0A5C1ADY4_9BACT|nr:hypothetical protein [Limnoglobus roseus]QEL17589.1 hypothetical protein PX52LOC_04585 [Limnoglobus roseus]